MSKFLALALVVGYVTTLGAATPSLSRYRDVSLGDSLSQVKERLQVADSDIKILYENPSLVQELTWRPHRFVSGTEVVPDPLGSLVLTFHVNRLTRIEVNYDRERTEGLTDADLVELLTSTYGLPLLGSTATGGSTVVTVDAKRRVVAGWADANAMLVLWREEYPLRIGLTISATVSDATMQTAMLEGARIAASGAPARDRERQAAAAADMNDRKARIRTENKAKFKP